MLSCSNSGDPITKYGSSPSTVNEISTVPNLDLAPDFETNPDHISTSIIVGSESNLLPGDKIYAELDAKLDGSDVARESQPFFLIQRDDGKMLTYNTDITPYISGKRTLIPSKPAITGDGNTITADVKNIHLNIYNLKGVDFKITVFGVNLYVIRNGARINLNVLPLERWTNGLSLSKENLSQIPVKNATAFNIGINGYMSTMVDVGTTNNLLENDKILVELDAQIKGSDSGFEKQPFFLTQGQEKSYFSYNTDISSYVLSTRTSIPGKVMTVGAGNTITSAIKSIYFNIYNAKGTSFDLTVYDARLYVMRGNSKIPIRLPPLNSWAQDRVTAMPIKIPSAESISGLIINAKQKIPQRNLLDNWPKLPQKYVSFDWQQRTKDFTTFIFDWNKKSEHPTIVWNSDLDHYKKGGVFTIPDYYGDVRIGYHNVLINTAAVFGASLAGMDMSAAQYAGQTYNYVDQLSAYYQPTTNILTTQPTLPRISDWWYDVTSNLMYYGLGEMYPGEANKNGMDERLKGIADAYYNMVVKLGGASVDWDHQGFDLINSKTIDAQVGLNYMDAGLGVAVIQYYAFKKFGDPKYLTAAKWALDYYERSSTSKFYDSFAQFGPYLAARMNAEAGTSYNSTKYIDWVLAINAANLGVFQTSFDGFDYFGAAGFKYSYGKQQRTYFLETTQYAWMLPAVKYDASLAKPLAKWMLNASASARHFFPDQNEPSKQAHGSKYINAKEQVIPYEVVEIESKEGISHFSESDNYRWQKDPNHKKSSDAMGPNCSYLSIYSGVWTGLWGGIIKNTNVEGILQLDVNKLDFYSKRFPTYLYYNPHNAAKKVAFNLTQPADLYDVISGKYIAQNASGQKLFWIAPDDVVMLVIAPAGSKRTFDGNKTLLNGVVVAYQRP